MIDITMIANTKSTNRGFALPVVLIASIVMLMVLLSGLVAASSTNTAVRDQHHQKAAQLAADAGLAYAQACLKKNNYISQWTAATAPNNVLKPNTNCDGSAIAGFSCPIPGSTAVAIEARCAVTETAAMRTTYEVSPVVQSSGQQTYKVTGTAYIFKNSSRVVTKQYKHEAQGATVFKQDASATRPTSRFWYMGNRAGIDFGASGTTQSTAVVAPCTATCVAGEGSTVISNNAGTLQFWTDGRTIWNRTGAEMLNGGGLNANQSTTQAAAVFPIGTDEKRYVVITNTTENGTTNVGRLWYSIIDMDGDSGRGAVTTKNGVLSTVNNSSEALAAAPKRDGSGYWVLTYTPFTLNMVVYSFNNDGVPSTTPVAQPSGTISPLTNYPNLGGFGTLNFDSTYTKLVMMAGDHCMASSCPTREGVVRLMSFNSSTGQVSYDYDWQSYPDGAGYSADFSPSGNYIYTSAIYPGRLARYQVAGNTTSAAIKASQAFIGVTHVLEVAKFYEHRIIRCMLQIAAHQTLALLITPMAQRRRRLEWDGLLIVSRLPLEP